MGILVQTFWLEALDILLEQQELGKSVLLSIGILQVKLNLRELRPESYRGHGRGIGKNCHR